MDYEKILKGIEQIINTTEKSDIGFANICTYISENCPELHESENERIRKAVIEMIHDTPNVECEKIYNVCKEDVLAWLEKQAPKTQGKTALEAIKEEKVDNANKVEPKFKVGDWVVLLTSDGEKIVQINSVEYFKSGEPRYITSEGKWFGNGTKAHLWTIKDAKDGDILSYVTAEDDLWIMIYWSLYKPYEGHVHYHALLVNDNFSGKGTCCICIDNLKPATKEQCNLLFQKMREAGY